MVGNEENRKALFIQNIIAVIWDFDKTLTPGYMQKPLFNKYQVKAEEFWEEVKGLEKHFKNEGHKLISPDTLYLNHILTYVRKGKFKGLNNDVLRKLGQKIKFYKGVKEIFEKTKKIPNENETYKQHEIKVEHYIISTGLVQMILGSEIAEFVEGVWACEFAETEPDPGYLKNDPQLIKDDSGDKEIVTVIYALDNTTKTRAIFEINKGCNKHKKIDVNATIAHEDRRIPFQNMIYIADGPSDIPVFSLIKQSGGKTYAVYKPGEEEEFRQANKLLDQGRVCAYGEANYAEKSPTYYWICNSVKEIADRIVKDRKESFNRKISQPPKHITENNHNNNVFKHENT